MQGRYRVMSPLVPNDPRRPNDLYEVQDTQGRQEIKVLKVLKWQESKYIELFEREAFVLQALEHPGIPKGYGLFKFLTAQNEELYCFVMDKIPGQTLEQWLREHHRASEKLVLRCLRQLLTILEYLHQEEYLHRDIKPANVMLTPSGEFSLIDFGSVQILGDAKTQIISDGYTAPDQSQGKASIQSDIYALGRTIIHLATGIHPTRLKSDSKSGRLLWHRRARQISKTVKQTIDQFMISPATEQWSISKKVAQKLNTRSLLRKRILSPLGLTSIALTLLSMILIGDLYRKFVNDKYIQELYAGFQQQLMDGEIEQAERTLRSTIRLNLLRLQRESKHYNDLGLLCSFRSNYGCALENYDKSIELATNENTVSMSHYQKGIIYQKMERFDDALTQYEIAISGIDQDSLAYPVIANRYSRLLIWYERDWETALALSEEVLAKLDDALNVDISLTAKNFGWALLEKGDLDRAQAYLSKSIAADNSDATSYCLLAQVSEAQGDVAGTRQWWQECESRPNEYNLPETTTWQQQATRYLRS